MNNKQTSRKALVTGGSKGIGRAIVKKLTDEGVAVIIADIIEPEPFEQPGLIHFRQCNVGKKDEVATLFDWINKNIGSPDMLILCAGRGIQEKLTEGDPEKWQQIFETNLMGPLRCLRAFVPQMLEKKEGQVVFISSVSAYQPHQYGGIYTASKTALEVIAETLRLETMPHLRTTVLSPGIVDTSFYENQISGKNSVDEMGMGFISAEEIAEDVWYALNKKKGTSINKMVTRPVLQSF